MEKIKCCFIGNGGVQCSNKPYYTVVDETSKDYPNSYWHVCKQHVGDFWEEGNCKLYGLDWKPESFYTIIGVDKGAGLEESCTIKPYNYNEIDVGEYNCKVNMSKTDFMQLYWDYTKYLEDRRVLESTGIICAENVYENLLFAFDILGTSCLGEDGYQCFLNYVHESEEDNSFFKKVGVNSVEDLYDYLVKESKCNNE